MELRHLRYFMAVAETGNLSRAAEKLFIAQPPLSVQIRQLEKEMGTPLFVRHPKGVRLTAAGETLMPEARSLLDRAAHMKEVLQGGGSTGQLALGYVPSASSTVLPALLRRIRKEQPGLRIELREMISSDQADALVAGHLDAGIARTRPQHPRLQVATQMPDPFCLAVPAAEKGAARGVVDLRAYAEHDFIAFTRHRGPAYFDQSIHLCAKAGFSARIRYEASTVHGVLDLVSAGLGVALVPASCALLGARGVKFRGLRGARQGEVLTLLRRRSDAQPVLPMVEEAVSEIFAELQRRVATAIGADSS
ncbi:LysR family transcriptional regulator [Variovorax paradoxus]|nr:LysR family transcriptional regulator [Variovorax paradoxus]